MPKRTSKTTSRASKRPAPPSVPYEPRLIASLKDPREAAAYLEAAIEDGDQGVLMLALRHVAQAQGGLRQSRASPTSRAKRPTACFPRAATRNSRA